ncbi:MAG: DeoR/GlpR family DNA-binding transcription regulator [Alphaproteobacteria bacterium]
MLISGKVSKRHAEILNLVRATETCTIVALARRLNVSPETIRRDVGPLTASGLLVKMHGAVGLPHAVGEAPFEKRMRVNASEKQAIARRLAETIEDGDSVMLDTGTTTSLVARALLNKRSLTVVTNSSDIARTLATANGNTVFMAGGELHGDNGAAFGTSAIEFIERFKVDHAVISIGAMDEQVGPMDYRLAEAEFARCVLARGQRRVIVTDRSKFGRSSLVKVCGFDGFDCLITDAAPPVDLADILATANVKVEVANAGKLG